MARGKGIVIAIATSPGVSISARKEIGESPSSSRVVILPYESERSAGVHEVRGVYRGERYCGTRPSLMSQPTPCATATNRTAPGRDGTGWDRTGQDRLSLGIRTVNPGFYSPGIEVYSVLSWPRPCASYPFAYVCLSYVQPSCGKTFAYLRSSTRCWPARVRKASPFPPLSRPRSLSSRCPLDRRRFLGSVCHPPPLCSRNEIFVKNARFILTSPPDTPYSPRPLLTAPLEVSFVLSSINRLSGELNLSDGPALSNAPT